MLCSRHDAGRETPGSLVGVLRGPLMFAVPFDDDLTRLVPLLGPAITEAGSEAAGHGRDLLVVEQPRQPHVVRPLGGDAREHNGLARPSSVRAASRFGS